MQSYCFGLHNIIKDFIVLCPPPVDASLFSCACPLHTLLYSILFTPQSQADWSMHTNRHKHSHTPFFCWSFLEKVSKLSPFPFPQGPHISLWEGRGISSSVLPLPACRIWSLLSISNRGRPPQGTFAIQSSACCCFRQHQAVTNTPLNLQSSAQRGEK